MKVGYNLTPSSLAHPPQRPKFGNTSESTSTKDQYGVNRNVWHATGFYRWPELIRALPNYLSNRFPKERYPNGVDLKLYAGSDRSEGLSVAVSLLDQLTTEEANRFFPLDIVELSKNLVDKINENQELFSFNADMVPWFQKWGIQSPMERFFKPQTEDNTQGKYRIQPELLNKIRYRQGDITLEARQKSSKPTAVFFSNAWYQLNTREYTWQIWPVRQFKLARDLYNNLPKGSVLIVGQIEKDNPLFPPMLKLAGFRQVAQSGPLMGIFEKN